MIDQMRWGMDYNRKVDYAGIFWGARHDVVWIDQYHAGAERGPDYILHPDPDIITEYAQRHRCASALILNLFEADSFWKAWVEENPQLPSESPEEYKTRGDNAEYACRGEYFEIWQTALPDTLIGGYNNKNDQFPLFTRVDNLYDYRGTRSLTEWSIALHGRLDDRNPLLSHLPRFVFTGPFKTGWEFYSESEWREMWLHVMSDVAQRVDVTDVGVWEMRRHRSKPDSAPDYIYRVLAEFGLNNVGTQRIPVPQNVG